MIDRQIARPDTLLRGEESGAGPTVLLLHAGGERRRVWRPVIEILVAAGWRCVAFDQRGHGDSGGSLQSLAACAEDVAAMLHAEPPGCVVVGASLGGLAAIAALGDPAVRARVAGVVLVDVVPDLEPRRVRSFLDASGLLDAHTAIVDDILAQVPRLRHITAALDVPILLVHGDNGSPITTDDVDRLLELAPHTRVIPIQGAGHLVARDQPAVLARTLAAATAEWPALALLSDLGAGQVTHPGGNLLDHLKRVHHLVESWKGEPHVRLAALCHATYGTDGFPSALLPLDQRTRLRITIGERAEALVYLYDACDRRKTYARLGATPLLLANRFTGLDVALSPASLADFALLTIANELDVARTAALTPQARRDLRILIAALAPHSPDAAAQALADPSLQ